MHPYKLAELKISKGRYYVEYYVTDIETNKLKRIKVYVPSKHCINKKSALNYSDSFIQDINYKLRMGFVYGKQKEVKKLNVIDALLNAISLRTQLRNDSLRTYRSGVNIFKEFLNDSKRIHIEFSELNSTIVKEFQRHCKDIRKNSNTTINNNVSNLRIVFSYLIEDNVISKNPFSGCTILQESHKKNLPFSETQIVELRQSINDLDINLYRATQLILYTYIRPNELRNIRLSDITDKSLLIDSSVSKTKRFRSITLPNKIKEMFQEMKLENFTNDCYLFGKLGEISKEQHGRNYFSRLHRKILDGLDYPKEYEFYSWKHTGMIQAYKQGIDMKSIQLQAGHKSIEMTDNYFRSFGLVTDSKFTDFEI